MDILVRLLTFFKLPKTSGETVSTYELDNNYSLHATHIFLVTLQVLTFGYALVFHFVYEVPVVAAVLYASTGIGLVLHWWLRRYKSYFVIGNVVLFIAFVVLGLVPYFTGGMVPRNAFWFMVTPIIAIYFLGCRVGTLWILTSVATIGAYMLAEFYGTNFNNAIPIESRTIDYYAAVFIAVGAISLFSIYYELIRKNNVVLLRAENQRREKSNRNHRVQNGILKRSSEGKPLEEILSEVALYVESNFVDRRCTIMLKDKKLGKTYPKAAPSYSAASSWAVPICDSKNNTLGSLAVQSQVPGEPKDVDEEFMKSAANLVGLVVEKQRRKEELDRSHQSMLTVQRIAKIGSWSWNIDDGLMQWSDLQFEMFGETSQSFVPTVENIGERIHPDDRERLNGELRRALKFKTGFHTEHRIVLPDGSDRFLRSEATFEWDDDGRASRLVGYSQDMTQQRHMERQQGKMQAQVFQAAKLASIGELAAGVAHEINNPLAIVDGYAELLQATLEDSGIQDEKYDKCFTAIEQSVQRIKVIVRDLKAFARPDDPEDQTLDLLKAVNRSLSLVGVIYKKEGIQITENISLNKAVVAGNFGKFQQVLVNLLTNARDATEELDDRKIDINLYRQGNNVVVEVADNGCGIPEAIKDKIFDSFFTTKPVGKGTGLGLGICHNLVVAMGGQLTVESEIDKGTKFMVSLPLVEMVGEAA